MRGRTLLAILIAPMFAPLVIAGLLYATQPNSSAWAPVAQVTLLSAYSGMVVFGLPIAWWTKRRGVKRLGAACGWGFAVGAVSAFVGVLAVNVLLKTWLRSSVPVKVDLSWLPLLIFGGVMGVIVGIVFWFIARPDLSRDAQAEPA